LGSQLLVMVTGSLSETLYFISAIYTSHLLMLPAAAWAAVAPEPGMGDPGDANPPVS